MTYSVAAERQAHALNQRAQLRGWPTEGALALAAAARDHETVSVAVSCHHCGTANLTPPCDNTDAAHDYLDTIGWWHTDSHAPICPNCATGGAA